MAVTKIWTIKDSLQRVLDYAANPDKTEYDALAQTLHYAENDTKTNSLPRLRGILPSCSSSGKPSRSRAIPFPFIS